MAGGVARDVAVAERNDTSCHFAHTNRFPEVLPARVGDDKRGPHACERSHGDLHVQEDIHGIPVRVRCLDCLGTFLSFVDGHVTHLAHALQNE